MEVNKPFEKRLKEIIDAKESLAMKQKRSGLSLVECRQGLCIHDSCNRRRLISFEARQHAY